MDRPRRGGIREVPLGAGKRATHRDLGVAAGHPLRHTTLPAAGDPHEVRAGVAVAAGHPLQDALPKGTPTLEPRPLSG